LLCDDDGDGVWTPCYADLNEALTDAYVQDIRDPSAYFVTYETGDNSVVTVETATVPLDMYYSKGYNFGDDYDMLEIAPTGSNGNAEDFVWRWDWLENGPDLATEASVAATANGNKFYAVWNQELEVDYEVYTDMDMLFRRIYYNYALDTKPIVASVTASHTAASQQTDTIVLTGTGRDTDRLGTGIVEVEWVSNLDGILGDEKVLSIPAASLSEGIHTISFSVMDDEGNWSAAKQIKILVADQIYRIFTPLNSGK
jgi:hypothetical protein